MITAILATSSSNIQAQCYSAVQLDGTNEYMHTPFSNYTFTTFTMEMWINSANFLANEHYISLYQNSYIVLGGWDGSGSFDTWADGLSPIAINSNTVPSTNSWHHVAFVFDGTNQILYIDGTAVASSASSGSVTNSASFNSGLVIGARYDQTQQFTNTAFDDVRIWNVALTPTQLSANMNTNLTGNEAGLLAYYRFEDGQGSTTVTDLTGNGNTLTLYNMDPMTDWFAPTSSIGSAVNTTDTQTACDSYTWIDGNTYTSNNNTATFTFAGGAANGCDSIVTLDLTINSQGTSVDSQIACNSYTWIDGTTYTSSNNTATFTIAGGSANGCDSIVTLDLTINPQGTSVDAHTACNSYTWIDGNTYTSSNNTATFTIAGGSANGCDSIVTLDLTINNVDVSVSSNEPTLSATAINATYQWIDCDNENAPISGETNQSFTATANGSYAVIVTQNGCADTSLCIDVSTIGIDELTKELKLVVYPNPSKSIFNVSYNGDNMTEFTVCDLAGRTLKTGYLLNGNNLIELDSEPKGIYILKIESEIVKLVKQ